MAATMRWSSARRRSWGVWSPSCAPAAQHHGGHHDSGLEDDLFDPDTREGEKARECSGDTHGRPSFVRLPEQLRTYGPVRVTSRSASRPTWSRLLSSLRRQDAGRGTGFVLAGSPPAPTFMPGDPLLRGALHSLGLEPGLSLGLGDEVAPNHPLSGGHVLRVPSPVRAQSHRPERSFPHARHST